MSKVLIVSDSAELEKMRLEALGHDVAVVGRFDDVRRHLKSNPDTKVVVWEGVVGNQSVADKGYAFSWVSDVRVALPDVINVGVCADPHWAEVLEKVGCNEVVAKLAFEEKIQALLQ